MIMFIITLPTVFEVYCVDTLFCYLIFKQMRKAEPLKAIWSKV